MLVSKMRYQDTGAPDNEVCPGRWFDENVQEGIQSFRGQFGFFRFGAIHKYAEILHGLAVSGGTVNLVIGSNTGDPMTAQDARELLGVLGDGVDAHLTVIALSNALFHPKVAHVLRSDGVAGAIVGSPNMTQQALSVHVEAWMELESGVGVADHALNDIVTAIDRWHTTTESGVHQIRSDDDIERLLAQGIIIDASDRRAKWAASREEARRRRTPGRGSRRARWRPPAYTRNAEPGGEGEMDVAPEALEDSPATGRIVLRWSKKLSPSDVNRNRGHVRNLLSLPTGRSPFSDDRDYLRNTFFANELWCPAEISKQPSEIAKVNFLVKLPMKRSRSAVLDVVHAPHRESRQRNYRTSIRWGKLAGALQKAPGKGFVGYWVVIDKYDTDEFSLTIAVDEPIRRFIG